MKTVRRQDLTDIDVGKSRQATKQTDINAEKFVKWCAGRDIDVSQGCQATEQTDINAEKFVKRCAGGDIDVGQSYSAEKKQTLMPENLSNGAQEATLMSIS